MTFKEYLFGEIVEKWIDNRGKTPPLADVGIPLLEVKHLPESCIYPVVEGTKCVSNETYETWFRAYLEPLDILFSTVGTTARVTLTPESPVVAIAQNVLGIRFKKEIVDPLYMFYYMRGRRFQNDIEARLVTTVQASIKRADMVGIPVSLPPLEMQKIIGEKAVVFDQKIELNRQINQTLEQIAQTIFKSWFVDFEPVKAKIEAKTAGRDPERAAMCAISGLCPDGYKLEPELDQLTPEQYQQLAATAALFPDELVESELGLIPVGWEVKRLDNFAGLNTKSVSPSKEPDSIFEHYSIPAFDASGRPVYETGESIKSNKYKVETHSVLVSKLNPETPRIWLPNVKTSRAVCSTEFMQFVPKSKADRPYLFLLMKSETMQSEILQRVTGSTGSRQRAQPSQIAVLPVALPGARVRLKFSEMVSPLLNQIALHVGQAESLATLRDVLLPRLLSGELCIDIPSEMMEDPA